MDDQLRRDRKYKAFWGVFLFACVALFWNKLTGSEWVTVTMSVFGLYMAGNGLEHASKAWEARGETRVQD